MSPRKVTTSDNYQHQHTHHHPVQSLNQQQQQQQQRYHRLLCRRVVVFLIVVHESSTVNSQQSTVNSQQSTLNPRNIKQTFGTGIIFVFIKENLLPVDCSDSDNIIVIVTLKLYARFIALSDYFSNTPDTRCAPS
jgi:hypothetical protein